MTVLEQAETALMERVQRRRWLTAGAEAQVLVAAGPPGAGKSTVVQALAGQGFSVHLERPEGNPYLLDLLGGDASVGYRCQEWFVSSVESFLAGASRHDSIGIDQDPTATVLVYGRELVERRLLSEDGWIKLVNRLEGVEDVLAEWPSCRAVLLDATLDVLKDRIARRGAERPESFWLDELHERFMALGESVRWPRIDTSVRTPAAVVQSVLGFGGR